jgi:hypothetical protein
LAILHQNLKKKKESKNSTSEFKKFAKKHKKEYFEKKTKKIIHSIFKILKHSNRTPFKYLPKNHYKNTDLDNKPTIHITPHELHNSPLYKSFQIVLSLHKTSSSSIIRIVFVVKMWDKNQFIN